MGDVLVDSPIQAIPPQKKPAVSDAIPDIDPLEGVGSDNGDEYSTLKRLQRHLEYVGWLLRRPSARLTVTGTSNCKKNTSRMSRGLYRRDSVSMPADRSVQVAEA